MQERFPSPFLSLDDRKTPLPSNFSIKHSRDAKFGREEILARVSSSPTCLFLFIRPGDSPAGARLCRWLQKINKKKKKKKGEGGIRTRTSISRDISRGKLYYLDAWLTGGGGEGIKKHIISTLSCKVRSGDRSRVNSFSKIVYRC